MPNSVQTKMSLTDAEFKGCIMQMIWLPGNSRPSDVAATLKARRPALDSLWCDSNQFSLRWRFEHVLVAGWSVGR